MTGAGSPVAARRRQAGNASLTPRAAQPERAAHERERKLPPKPDAHVRGRQAATRTTKESNVPLTQRLAEFPNQCMRV